MEIELKLLPSGYWYARSLRHHHLFAQWPTGTFPILADVSHNGIPFSSQGELLDVALAEVSKCTGPRVGNREERQ